MAGKSLIFLLGSGFSGQYGSVEDDVVSFNQETAKAVENCTYHKRFANKQVKFEDCIFRSVDIFKSLKEIDLNGQSLFSNIFAYDGMSLFDAESNRILSGHKEYIAKLVSTIMQVENVIEKSDPSEIITYGDPQVEESIIAKVSIKKNIPYNQKSLNHTSRVGDRSIFKNSIGDTYWKEKKCITSLQVPISFSNYSRLIMIRGMTRQLTLDSQHPSGDYDIIVYLHNLKWMESIGPVIDELSKKYEILLISRSESYSNLEYLEYDVDLYKLESYISPQTERNTIRNYIRVINSYNNIYRNINISKKVKICGLSFEGVINKWVKDIIFHSHNSIRYYLIMDKIVKEHNPECLITPHDSQNFVKSFAQVCSKENIPNINIRTGAPNLTSECSLYNGTKLLVPGESTKEIFTSLGVSPEKLVITGLPRFNSLVDKLKSKNKIENQVREKLGIGYDKQIVTYITQTNSGRFKTKDKKREINTVYESISGINDVHLIVKTHPSENNKNLYREIAKESQINSITITHSDLNKVLIASDVSLTKTSTAGFNSIIAGNKLIILNTDDRDITSETFAGSGLFPVVNDSESLAITLDNKTNMIDDGNEDNSQGTIVESDSISDFISYHYKYIGQSPEKNIFDEIVKSIQVE